ncbi:MAG: DUF1343 domain-containing protein [Actinomycetota bacterium]
MSLLVFVAIASSCSGGRATAEGEIGADSASNTTDSLPGETTQSSSDAAGADTDATASTGVVTTGEDDVDGALPAADSSPDPASVTTPGAAIAAASGFEDFFGLRVGLVANRASVVGDRSVIDLLAETDGVELAAIFAPEHGLRADAGAGEIVADGIDPVTGLVVHSLYGEVRQPTPAMLDGLDVLVFDLQDVGARFYTYTATMGLAMQAAAAADLPFVVFDRPNPLGAGPAGSSRAPEATSFVSQYPTPSLHGLTAGELALAIEGEGWLDGLEGLDLRVVPLAGWDRTSPWSATGLAWVPPSPGLPTEAAALAYPATVLFEATTLSYGRGTEYPFQQIGAPWLDGPALAAELSSRGLPGARFEPVDFTPVAGPAAADPQYEGQPVSGVRLVVEDPAVVDQPAVGVHLLDAVLAQAAAVPGGQVEVIDRPAFLDLLTGSDRVRLQLVAGRPAADIVAGWAEELADFDRLVEPYRLY